VFSDALGGACAATRGAGFYRYALSQSSDCAIDEESGSAPRRRDYDPFIDTPARPRMTEGAMHQNGCPSPAGKGDPSCARQWPYRPGNSSLNSNPKRMRSALRITKRTANPGAICRQASRRSQPWQTLLQ
jgi:hypothetical protein